MHRPTLRGNVPKSAPLPSTPCLCFSHMSGRNTFQKYVRRGIGLPGRRLFVRACPGILGARGETHDPMPGTASTTLRSLKATCIRVVRACSMSPHATNHLAFGLDISSTERGISACVAAMNQ
jgi:hypothetical protein